MPLVSQRTVMFSVIKAFSQFTRGSSLARGQESRHVRAYTPKGKIVNMFPLMLPAVAPPGTCEVCAASGDPFPRGGGDEHSSLPGPEGWPVPTPGVPKLVASLTGRSAA